MKTMKLPFLLMGIFLGINLSLQGTDTTRKSNPWEFALEINLSFNQPQTNEDELAEKSDFIQRGLVKKTYSEMPGVISSIPKEQRTTEGLTKMIKRNFYQSFFSEKIGALAYLNKGFHDLYNDEDNKNLKGIEMNDLIANLIAYENKERKEAELIGTCRDYAILTARIAKQGSGLKASVVSGQAHVMAQVVGPDKTLVLIDGGLIISNVDGRPLRCKDDVDIAIMRWVRKPEMTDVIIDPGKNAVVYENRYNNFSGFWKKIQNRDNSDRMRNFLMNNQNPELFSYLNERGVIRGSVEKGNIGLQAWWMRNNNKYQRFLEDAEGLNLAACFQMKRLITNPWNHMLFVNLGFYQSLMNMGEEATFNPDPKVVYFKQGKYAYTLDAQINIEDYLKYSVNRGLKLGLISKFQYNMEVSRDGGALNQDPDGYASLSPFAGFEMSRERSRTCFYVGNEITDYLALPNLMKLNAIPWFQFGFIHKEKLNFDVSLRGEFQKASQRFDWISHLKKGFCGLQVRAFFENYSKEFRQDNLFRNTAGIEAQISRYFKKGRQVSLGISGESDNGGRENILLNLGVKF